MTKFKHLTTIVSLTGLLLLSGCSNQIEDDAKKVAKFKCQSDALAAKMVQDPSNVAAYQTELTQLAGQEDAIQALNKKYRDDASPADQEKFKQALVKAIGEGCGSNLSTNASGPIQAPQAQPAPPAPAASLPANPNEPCFQPNETYFRCTIKGKPVGICTNFDTDDQTVSLIIGVSDKNGVNEYMNSVRPGDKEKFTVAQYSEGRATLTTVSLKDFNDKSVTYSVTDCQGMECNSDKRSWLTITKGQTVVNGGGVCDPESSTGFSFPFGEDKKGNLAIKNKDYFSLQKKPYSPVITTNRSWSE